MKKVQQNIPVEFLGPASPAQPTADRMFGLKSPLTPCHSSNALILPLRGIVTQTPNLDHKQVYYLAITFSNFQHREAQTFLLLQLAL